MIRKPWPPMSCIVALQSILFTGCSGVRPQKGPAKVHNKHYYKLYNGCHVIPLPCVSLPSFSKLLLFRVFLIDGNCDTKNGRARQRRKATSQTIQYVTYTTINVTAQLKYLRGLVPTVTASLTVRTIS